MSNPSFENIDRWFFEYTEGNLSSAQVDQLESFISAHPELKNELDVWQDAKITPEENNFSIANLIKPTPFYANSRILMVLIISLLAAGYFIYDNFGMGSIYTKSSNDLAIISVEDDDFFIDKIVNSTLNSDLRNTTVLKSLTEAQKVKLNESKKASRSEQILYEQSQSISESENISISVEPKEESLTYGDDLLVIERESIVGRSMSSEGLEDVVAYLNGGSDVTNDDYVVGHDKGNQIEVSQISFKRKLEKALRRIKRMADQPIALRNAKDQYIHVPMMTGYQANFGMAGSALGNRIQTTSRNQWVGESNQQLMNAVSWDGYVYALRGGLGVDVSYNNYSKNSLENYEASLTYSPKFSLNKNISIEPAVRFKMGAVNVDTKSDLIGSEIEMNRNTVLPLFQGTTTPIGSQLWYRDVGAGLLVNTKWFYTGVNVDNIGRHYNNFHSSDLTGEYNEAIHLTSIIGTEYQSMTRDVRVSAYVLHQNYGDLNEFWAGSNFQWKWLQVGAAANSNLGFGGSAGIKFEKFSLHYNVDNVYSRLNDEKLLSHQLTMRILLKPSRYAAKYLNM